MGSFWGTIFGAIFIAIILWVVYAVIGRLFSIKVDSEDFEGCFTAIGYIALAISIFIYILNQCSSSE